MLYAHPIVGKLGHCNPRPHSDSGTTASVETPLTLQGSNDSKKVQGTAMWEHGTKESTQFAIPCFLTITTRDQ